MGWCASSGRPPTACGSSRAAAESDPVRKDKLASARFFYEVLLPEAELLAKRVAVGKGPVMDVDVDLW